jgi:hypothetical protein
VSQNETVFVRDTRWYSQYLEITDNFCPNCGTIFATCTECYGFIDLSTYRKVLRHKERRNHEKPLDTLDPTGAISSIS